MSPIIYEALIKNKKNVRHNIFKSDVYSLGLCFVYALTKNVDVIQLEINGKYRDKHNIEKLEQLCKCFEQFIRQYNEYISKRGT